MTMDNKNVFYSGTSWYHRTKTLLPDGTTKYARKGGFKTTEEAEASYYLYASKFDEDKKLLDEKNKGISFFNKEIMFSDYLKYWVSEVFKNRVQSTTYMQLSYIVYNLIIPNIKYDVKLKLISENYINELLETIYPITKSAASESRKALFLALKDAQDDKYILNNPVINSKKYHYKRRNITLLNDDELKKLLLIARSGNWYLEILLALFCGLRKGEILGLKFSDFDYEKKIVTINRQIVNKYKLKKDEFKIINAERIESSPKSETSIRTMSVPDIILNEVKIREGINESICLQNHVVNNGYVSIQKNGMPSSQSAMNTYLNRTCKRNGIRRISVHGLRHMFATLLIENNVSLAKISALLGHSSVHTTFEYYTDVMNEKNKINNFMNNMYVKK